MRCRISLTVVEQSGRIVTLYFSADFEIAVCVTQFCVIMRDEEFARAEVGERALQVVAKKLSAWDLTTIARPARRRGPRPDVAPGVPLLKNAPSAGVGDVLNEDDGTPSPSRARSRRARSREFSRHSTAETRRRENNRSADRSAAALGSTSHGGDLGEAEASLRGRNGNVSDDHPTASAETRSL